ncbi:MAG: DNA repair protein RecN [Candidatus Cloacimonadia bacterium]
MIKSLRIKNFILVRDLDITFSEGLNILTGETGAGKSVIIGALDLILGQRVRGEVLFDKTKPAYLETVFCINTDRKEGLSESLKDYLDEDENELIIIREISPDGSNKSVLNGRRVPLNFIRSIRDELIDFHSQRDQIKLFSNNYQLDILDTYGDLIQKRNEYSAIYQQTKSKLKKLNNLEEERVRNEERKQLYEFQINELEEANLKIEEEQTLQSELDLLTHAEDILNDCGEMKQLFFEDELSLLDKVRNYKIRLERFSKDSPIIKEVIQYFQELVNSFNEIQSGLIRIEDSIDLDKGKMEEIEERLNLVLRLKDKYRMELPELIQFLENMRETLYNYNSGIEEIEKLKGAIHLQVKDLLKRASELSLDRKEASKLLREDILDDISKLALPESDFKVGFSAEEIKWEEDSLSLPYGLLESGVDKIDFLFSANRGMDLQSLKQSVSGGELSRLLLVFKKVLAGKLDTFSLIFDEIDTGIGGATARKTGEFIGEVARHHQVICITHLPQIAAIEGKHFLIEKGVEGMFTEIKVRELKEAERKEEIARMLAGDKSEAALKHAEELLNYI